MQERSENVGQRFKSRPESTLSTPTVTKMLLFSLFLCLSLHHQLGHASFVADHDNHIQTELILDTGSTGPSTTPDGRVFLTLPHVDGTHSPKIVGIFGSGDNTTLVAYPGER